MKSRKHVGSRRITLGRETLRNLDLGLTGADEEVAGTYPCYPPTIGPSCYEICPVKLTTACG